MANSTFRSYLSYCFDAIHYHVRRSEGQIVKKAVYIAIGISSSGEKDVIGMWVGENESAKFWLSKLNELKSRGVEDILIADLKLVYKATIEESALVIRRKINKFSLKYIKMDI